MHGPRSIHTTGYSAYCFSRHQTGQPSMPCRQAQGTQPAHQCHESSERAQPLNPKSVPVCCCQGDSHGEEYATGQNEHAQEHYLRKPPPATSVQPSSCGAKTQYEEPQADCHSPGPQELFCRNQFSQRHVGICPQVAVQPHEAHPRDKPQKPQECSDPKSPLALRLRHSERR